MRSPTGPQKYTQHQPSISALYFSNPLTLLTNKIQRLQQITSPSSPYSSPPSISGGQNKNNQHNHLRVTVTSGGCHGFQYLMSLEPSSAIEADTDTIFASSPPSSASGSSAKVVMDESSLELLKGSTIDYTTELIGSQFKIVGNPRAKSSCGCGTSFDIED